MTYGHVKAMSYGHSVVYAVLLVVWLVPGLHPFEFVFGLAHGLGWIAMCVVAVVAERRRVIPLWLAATISIVGAIGPFAGSLAFALRGQR